MGVESGHYATLAFESGAVTAGAIAAPVSGTFTAVPGIQGDILGFSGTRATTKFTPHGQNIGQAVTGPVERDDQSFSINFDPSVAVHVAMRAAYLANTTALRRRGWRYWGPSGAAGSDEVIQTGEISGWKDSAPEGAGVRKVDVTITFTSPEVKIDGVIFS